MSKNFQEIIRVDEPAWRTDHLDETNRQLLKDLPNKRIAATYADSLGMATPRVFASGVDLDAALAAGMAHAVDGFVIKPERATGSVGVMMLQQRDGGLTDVLAGAETSRDAVAARLARIGSKRDLPDRWVCEELLWSSDGHSRAIDDIKLYTFDGEVALILQRRNGWRERWPKRTYRWRDRDWNPVDTGKYLDALDPAITPPAGAARLIEEAERVSRRLPNPFMRIDLYDTTRGVVFGEFTPAPGKADRFSPERNDRLVACWHDTADRKSRELAETAGFGVGKTRE